MIREPDGRLGITRFGNHVHALDENGRALCGPTGLTVVRPEAIRLGVVVSCRRCRAVLRWFPGTGS